MSASGNGEAGRVVPGREPVTRPRPGDVAGLPSNLPTGVMWPQSNDAVASGQPVTKSAPPRSRPTDMSVQSPIAAVPGDMVRYGPGVPAAPPAAGAALKTERAWRRGPTAPRNRGARLRRILGYALTVILLAASGVLFYLRFHHAPLDVTRVAIVRSGDAACRVTVRGQISTNGGPGMVTYQWLFPVGPPVTLHQSVSAGQTTVDVQVMVDGSGHGTAPQRIWLRVLRPERRAASEYVLVSCP
jgi:hypothetical protein